jgi:hypothetical protein
MAVVYQHKRNDTNEIFYIGIGRSKDRAGKKTNRNKYWHSIVNKFGFTKIQVRFRRLLEIGLDVNVFQLME